jgi:glycosyltransferase involved in cell wall biosynthesis
VIPNSTIFFSGELPPESLNGVSYSNASLIKHLEKKHTVIIDKEFVDLKYHKKISLFKALNFIRRLLNVLKKSFRTNFDFFYLVFSNSLLGAIKTLLIIYTFKLFNLNSKVIIHVHRGDLDKNIKKSFLFKFIFRQILKTCYKLIVLSNSLADFISAYLSYKKTIICLENTVFDEVEIEKHKYSSETLNCIFISNYIEEKGILFLLDSFRYMDSNFKLNCYGSFSDENLKENILKYESDNIKINGPIYDHDKFSIISKSDLLILPSFNEGKPLILLESMMLGTPFIASNVGYINELVNSNYPFLLDKIEKDSLIKSIKKFASLSISEKNTLSNILSARYTEKYSNNIYFEKINQIFND